MEERLSPRVQVLDQTHGRGPLIEIAAEAVSGLTSRHEVGNLSEERLPIRAGMLVPRLQYVLKMLIPVREKDDVGVLGFRENHAAHLRIQYEPAWQTCALGASQRAAHSAL